MARPVKRALDFFRKDTNYYDDDKIISLLDEYGPAGQTIYDVVITLVYKNGYYLELTPDKLAALVTRIIGGRWVKKGFVLQVILYCADIGLFQKDLLTNNVITSAGIQKRYSDVTARNKVNKSKYWLLNDVENVESPVKSENDTALKNSNLHTALESVPISGVSASKTRVSVTETPVNAAEMQQSKINKSKIYNCVCAAAFGLYGCVNLTETQHTQLIEKYGDKTVEEYINRVDEYVYNSGKKPYQNHYATIIKWIDEDKLKSGTKRNRKKSHDIDNDPSFDIALLKDEFDD